MFNVTTRLTPSYTKILRTSDVALIRLDSKKFTNLNSWPKTNKLHYREKITSSTLSLPERYALGVAYPSQSEHKITSTSSTKVP